MAAHVGRSTARPRRTPRVHREVMASARRAARRVVHSAIFREPPRRVRGHRVIWNEFPVRTGRPARCVRAPATNRVEPFFPMRPCATPKTPHASARRAFLDRASRPVTRALHGVRRAIPRTTRAIPRTTRAIPRTTRAIFRATRAIRRTTKALRPATPTRRPRIGARQPGIMASEQATQCMAEPRRLPIHHLRKPVQSRTLDVARPT
jgi:hypothetical protein